MMGIGAEFKKRVIYYQQQNADKSVRQVVFRWINDQNQRRLCMAMSCRNEPDTWYVKAYLDGIILVNTNNGWFTSRDVKRQIDACIEDVATRITTITTLQYNRIVVYRRKNLQRDVILPGDCFGDFLTNSLGGECGASTPGE